MTLPTDDAEQGPEAKWKEEEEEKETWQWTPGGWIPATQQ